MTEAYEAAVCTALDGPSAVRVQPRDRGELPADGVRVRVHAAGVNFPDLLMTRGLYQHRAEPPFVPGVELAGEVIEVGPESAWRAGDRVAGVLVGVTGAFAAEAVLGADQTYPWPRGFSAEEAATFYVAASTAYHALVDRAVLRTGESVLVLGATGGVGLAAVQVAKALGARVVAAGTSAEKLRHATAAGADAVLVLGQDDAAAVLEAAGLRSVDVVLDPIGWPAAKPALKLLGWGGRYLIVGFAAGEIPNFAANQLLLRGHSAIGVRAGESARRDPELRSRNAAALVALAERGLVRPLVSARYPLSRTADALLDLEERRAVGRIAILPGELPA